MFKAILKNLVPDNFKENKLIMDVLDIFVDYIYENSNLALDINNLYNSKNEVLFEEVIKTYAANFYKTISDGTRNHKLAEAVRRAHEKWGFQFDDVKLDIRAIDLISKEQLELMKSFQQSKGTLRSIEFVYKIIEQLNIESFTLETDGQLRLREGENIFEYIVEGSMLPEIFEAFVKPLAHPVGWVCLYLRTYSLYFEDYFLSKEVFDVKVFRVVCEDECCEDNFITNEGYLFETDQENNILYDDDYKTKPRMYKAIGEPVYNKTRFGVNYPELTLKSELILVGSTTIKTIEKSSIKGNEKITIWFESGEYLEQNSNPKSLILYYGFGQDDLERGKEGIKKDYTSMLDKCSLELSYNRKVVTTVKDANTFQVDFGLSSSTGKIAAVGAGNMYVGNRSYKLGEFLVNPDTPTSYYARFRNEILKTSNYKALYKVNNNEIRPLFSKIQSDFEPHIKIQDLNLTNQTDDLYRFEIHQDNCVFLDCIDSNFNKVEVDVELIENRFILLSEIKNLKLVYWDDKFRKTFLREIQKRWIKESDNKELGDYYFESEYYVINIFINNKRTKANIIKHFSDGFQNYRVYVDHFDIYTIQVIDETGQDSVQLKSAEIILSKENNYKVEIPFENKIFLNYFNNEFKRIDVRYNEFQNLDFKSVIISADLGSQKVDVENTENITVFNNGIVEFQSRFDFEVTNNTEDILELEDFEQETITAEIFYLDNIKEEKTLVYFENQNISERDIPFSVTLDDETKFFDSINSIQKEFNVLKLYFNKDIKDRQASITALNQDFKLLENIDFTLSKTINTKSLSENSYEVVFDKQLQKSYTMWLHEVYNRESSLYDNHYVGYFSTNDITHKNEFLKFSDKIDYKMVETKPWGLTAVDKFVIDAKPSVNGVEVIFKFTENYPIPEDVLSIIENGYYQNKWGWKHGYVDYYNELEYLPRFDEKVQRQDVSEVYQMDDFIVLGYNDITKDYMFKHYPVDKADNFSEAFLRNGQVSAPIEPNKIKTYLYTREPEI